MSNAVMRYGGATPGCGVVSGGGMVVGPIDGRRTATAGTPETGLPAVRGNRDRALTLVGGAPGAQPMSPITHATPSAITTDTCRMDPQPRPFMAPLGRSTRRSRPYDAYRASTLQPWPRPHGPATCSIVTIERACAVTGLASDDPSATTHATTVNVAPVADNPSRVTSTARNLYRLNSSEAAARAEP